MDFKAHVSTSISTEDITLGAQSDKSDIRRSSGSASFDIGSLYLNSSSPFDPLADVLNLKTKPPVYQKMSITFYKMQKQAINVQDFTKESLGVRL